MGRPVPILSGIRVEFRPGPNGIRRRHDQHELALVPVHFVANARGLKHQREGEAVSAGV